MAIDKKSWWIYEGTNKKHKNIEKLPKPPSWRDRETKVDDTFVPSQEEIELINTALYLRRPLLVTGKPGTGKSSLAKSVAYELDLGDVLHWQITTKSTLEDGLYNYDAIGRLQDSSLTQKSTPFFQKPKEAKDIGEFIRLGALGTAFASKTIRVLLIDEIDKSDIDLPNNLLHIFEENEFIIPELERHETSKHMVKVHGSDEKIEIAKGKVICKEFPLIIMTSNGEREFPPAFLRRCIHLNMKLPDEKKLAKIVEAHHLNDDEKGIVKDIIKKFFEKRKTQDLATDQLLNAIFLALKDIDVLDSENEKLLDSIWHSLSN